MASVHKGGADCLGVLQETDDPGCLPDLCDHRRTGAAIAVASLSASTSMRRVNAAYSTVSNGIQATCRWSSVMAIAQFI